MEDLVAVDVTRKTGDEPFRVAGEAAGSTLPEFWRWSGSDLLGNTMRGILAEYIVGLALGCTAQGTRREWDAADLVTADGVKVEVKSAAYLQTWTQERLSRISFGIQPTTGWDATTNTVSEARQRQADVYVFAVLTNITKRTVDPLDLDQWDFHVLPTARLNEAVPQKRTISLARLLALHPTTAGFGALREAVTAAGRSVPLGDPEA